MSVPRHMGRRWAAAIVGWLMVGAVLTTLLAWWGAWRYYQQESRWLASPLYPGFRGGRFEMLNVAEPRWPVRVPESWPIAPDVVSRHMAGGVLWNETLCASTPRSDHPAQRRSSVVYIIECGWPCAALAWWTQYEEDWSTRKLVQSERRAWTLTSASPKNIPLRFPLHVRWEGLIVNTVVWAVLAWSPLAVGLAVRRWLRGRRGGCLTCGYDLRGLPTNAPCPECGTGRSKRTAHAA